MDRLDRLSSPVASEHLPGSGRISGSRNLQSSRGISVYKDNLDAQKSFEALTERLLAELANLADGQSRVEARLDTLQVEQSKAAGLLRRIGVGISNSATSPMQRSNTLSANLIASSGSIERQFPSQRDLLNSEVPGEDLSPRWLRDRDRSSVQVVIPPSETPTGGEEAMGQVPAPSSPLGSPGGLDRSGSPPALDRAASPMPATFSLERGSSVDTQGQRRGLSRGSTRGLGAKYELRRAFTGRDNRSTPGSSYAVLQARARRASENVDGLHRFDSSNQSQHLEAVETDGEQHFGTFDPGSVQRLIVDLMILTVMLYELFVTPFMMGWAQPYEGWVMGGLWVGAIAWLAFIPINLRTGFYQDGMVVTKPSLIFAHYLTGYLLIDVLLMLSDAALVVAGVWANNFSSGRATWQRVMRVVSVTKFLHTVHLAEICGRIVDRCQSTIARYLAVQCLGVVLLTVWINHILACLWYALGQYGYTETGETWLSGHGVAAGLDTTDPLYEYSTSMHWAVTQMTLGSMEVVPSNSRERIFSVFCLIIGVFFFSILVSAVSAHFVQSVFSRQETLMRLAVMRQFLSRAEVPQTLLIRVERQVREKTSSTKPLSERDVKAFQVLSPALRKELRCELCIPVLIEHPLFQLCSRVDVVATRSLCDEAVELIGALSTETLFLPYTEATQVFYLKSGQATYVTDNMSSHASRGDEDAFGEGTWFCQQALFVEWVTAGKLDALADCEFLLVDAEKAVQSLMKSKLLADLLVAYARQFHIRMQSVAEATDVMVQGTDFDEIVPSLRSDLRIFTGLVAIEMLRSKQADPSPMLRRNQSQVAAAEEALSTLEKEVGAEQCVLTMHGSEVVRIIAVSVLEVTNDDGLHLMHLGRWKRGQNFVVECRSPGILRRPGELPEDTVDRMLNGKLQPFGKGVLLATSRQVVEQKESTPGEVTHTKYIKDVTTAVFEAERCPVSENFRIRDNYLLTPPVKNARSANVRAPQQRQCCCFPARESKRQVVEPEALEELRTDVYSVVHESSVHFFAWLTIEEVAELQKPAAEDSLRRAMYDLAQEAEVMQRLCTWGWDMDHPVTPSMSPRSNVAGRRSEAGTSAGGGDLQFLDI
mmetsp:Transcript_22865/g.53503  ORF Transcript_22865/g.53503 Transcript_22865/m.53503 type:complete len:1105 (+) Transcript_22865:80-3394(+)